MAADCTSGPVTPLGVTTLANTNTCVALSLCAGTVTVAEPALSVAAIADVARAAADVVPTYTEHWRLCVIAGLGVTVTLVWTPATSRLVETASDVGYVNPAAPSTKTARTTSLGDTTVDDGCVITSATSCTPVIGEVSVNVAIPLACTYVSPVAATVPIVIARLLAVRLVKLGPVSVRVHCTGVPATIWIGTGDVVVAEIVGNA
jgi:hypothetical protein